MAGLAVSNRVIPRSAFGQFISECEYAKHATLEDMAEAGAELSRAFAPKGHKPDPRTTKLVDSISSHVVGNTARWEANARHALAQERGAPEHDITGWVNFFWEREGRDWEPGPNTIHHPGNLPHPYLRPAYEIIMERWMTFARRHFPQ